MFQMIRCLGLVLFLVSPAITLSLNGNLGIPDIDNPVPMVTDQVYLQKAGEAALMQVGWTQWQSQSMGSLQSYVRGQVCPKLMYQAVVLGGGIYKIYESKTIEFENVVIKPMDHYAGVKFSW